MRKFRFFPSDSMSQMDPPHTPREELSFKFQQLASTFATTKLDDESEPIHKTLLFPSSSFFLDSLTESLCHA